MNDDLKEIIIFEIRENRTAISDLEKKVDAKLEKVYEKQNSMDKHIFSNKIKLSVFIGAITVCCNVIAKIYWP